MSKETNSAQDFDRIFREKLGGHSVAPPAGMWENINANTHASKRRRGLLWIITNDTTIMLLILLTSFFMLFGEGTDLMANISNAESKTPAAAIKPNEEKSESATTNTSVSATSEPEFISESNNSTVAENTADRYNDSEFETVESKSKTAFKSNMNSNYQGQGDLANLNSEEMKDVKPDETAQPSAKNDDASTDYEASAKRVENANETTLTAVEMTNSKLEKTEDTEPQTSNDFNQIQGENIASNVNKSMSEKLRKMALIRPFLKGAFEEDSLKNFETPKTPPRDLVRNKDHEVFVGVHANFNLPLIFNQNTYGAFDGKELAYKPTFGLASGAIIGYTFKKQYGFQTGFIFYSQQGQNYDDNLNGFAARRQVKLQYFHVPLVLRYKFKIKKQKKFEAPWVLNLGADVGILRSAEITYDGNAYPLGTISNPEANDMDYFKPIDVSVVLGVEKEIYFTKWLMMSIGMRTTFSGDINADGHPVENDGKNYDKSHNFTFGFTLGFNYYMRK